MTRIPLVAGNWKMHTNQQEAEGLAATIGAGAPPGVELTLAPPFPWLLSVAGVLDGTDVSVAAQNCWTDEKGAFTGEVSADMLRGVCRYVIVGHSERRRLFNESDDLVARKATAVLAAGLAPIICVGETLEIRQAGGAEDYVRNQVRCALEQRTAADLKRCVIAYEPVWAIGTGVPATPHDAEEMASAIRSTVRGLAETVAEKCRILYGGSVTPDNAGEIASGSNVDGALVGGASLKAESFLAIARSMAR